MTDENVINYLITTTLLSLSMIGVEVFMGKMRLCHKESILILCIIAVFVVYKINT